MSSLLNQADTSVGRLAARARRQSGLTDHLRDRLSDELADGLQSSNVRDDGTLVITAASSEWCARLRFEADSLLSACRELEPGTARVKFRVGTGT